jgi:D-lactate dehydrogenase
MIDVIFYEVFEEEEKALKKYLPSDIHAEFTDKTIQERKGHKPPAELISIRTQSEVPAGWAEGIKGVLTRSQGYDHLEVFRRVTGGKVPCGYLNNYCARAVAEQAVLAMMALLRKLKKQIACFDTFKRDGLTGFECRGRKALVVGIGNIGSQIVDIAQGLRMAVKGVDIERKLKDLSYVSLSEGIPWADAVFCALPLTPETRGMFNYNVFKKARPGLIFINIARGEIAPEEDLKRLLSDGLLGGLSLDIYSQESSLANYLRGSGGIKNPSNQTVLDLKENSNVLFTPHNAFNTQEALEKKAERSAASVISFLRTGKFPYPLPAQ